MTISNISIGIAAMSAAATAAIQSTAVIGSTPMLSLYVPIVSALIGGAMSYAMLKSTVGRLEQDVRDMKKDTGEIYTLLRESMTRLAHMEGRLESGH